MDKEKLKQYFWLNHEIKKQRKRLERIENMKWTSGDITTDVVSGSSESFPYGPRRFTISGQDEKYDLTCKHKERLENAIKAAEEAREEIENYIETVPDARLRELLRDRFIECLKWEEIGKRNFCAPDHARALVRKFLAG